MAQVTAQAREERVKTDGDLTLFVRSWRPTGDVRGVVAVVPGFNSHSGYYGWAAARFGSESLATYAVDLRGRGQSDGERFFVDSFDDYVHDVAALAVFKGVSHVAPHARILHLKNELFSRDAAVVHAMNDDPLIAHETQSTKTMAAMVRADERLKKEFPNITLPVLILHGTADKATKPSGSQRFYDSAGSTDKTLKLYDGHYHDLLNDVGKEIVMADILAWISAH
jgi:alpha-beta hydrolase superfamily lysophospholipase